MKWENPNKTFKPNKQLPKQFKLPLKNRFTNMPEETPSINMSSGDQTYSTVTQQTTIQNTKRKTLVIGDSMTKRIKVKDFNNYTPQHQSFFNRSLAL